MSSRTSRRVSGSGICEDMQVDKDCTSGTDLYDELHKWDNLYYDRRRFIW